MEQHEGFIQAVFLRDEVNVHSFRMQAEVAIPGDVDFIGFVFGAKDTAKLYPQPFHRRNSSKTHNKNDN